MDSAKLKVWRQRVDARIQNVTRVSGRLSLRELQRRTNYNRTAAGVEEPIGVWYEILESLTKRKVLRVENADGRAIEPWEAERGDRLWAVWQGKRTDDTKRFLKAVSSPLSH